MKFEDKLRRFPPGSMVTLISMGGPSAYRVNIDFSRPAPGGYDDFYGIKNGASVGKFEIPDHIDELLELSSGQNMAGYVETSPLRGENGIAKIHAFTIKKSTMFLPNRTSPFILWTYDGSWDAEILDTWDKFRMGCYLFGLDPPSLMEKHGR